jgi:hypothetical protein
MSDRCPLDPRSLSYASFSKSEPNLLAQRAYSSPDERCILVWGFPAGHPELTLRILGVLLVRQDEP